MTESFIGREHELGVLEELHGSGRAEMFVLYGRRRVGKTELLQQFCNGQAGDLLPRRAGPAIGTTCAASARRCAMLLTIR